MHSKLIEEATHEQLKSFLRHQLDELKEYDHDLYEEMECDLYLTIYGPHFTEWKYEKAVSKLQNADGSHGPHWSLSDIVGYAKNKGVVFSSYNEWDFAYAMNIVYSDYYGSIPDTTESYYKVAKAFLDDKDAPEGKAWFYYKAMKH